MTYSYELEIQSFPNGEECERYGIGIFPTRREAEETAQRYLREVKGFCEYYCEYTIKESELVSEEADGLVHTYFGWNTDEDGNETDIVSGRLYAEEAEAEAAMEAAQKEFTREEWSMRHWQPGRCEWSEGFIREYPSGRVAQTMQEIRDTLRGCMEPRRICSVEFEYGDYRHCCFPLAVGEQLFLGAAEDDFILNGFCVRRLRDVYEISDRSGIYQKLFEAEGLTRLEAPEVDVSDWRSVFASLQKLGRNIIVEREYEDGYFYIGRIEEVAEEFVLLRHFDADGVWQKEPVAVLYRDVTSVTFGSRYVEVFSKYV